MNLLHKLHLFTHSNIFDSGLLLDIEAANLIQLLRLDHPELADKRKRYIKRKREDMIAYEQDGTTFFTTLINCDTCEVSYSRAVREEFGVDIWEIIN